MTGAREIRMMPRVGAQRNTGSAQDVDGPRSGASRVPTPGLNEVEKQIVECLRESGSGLTVGQLEARVLCLPEILQGALDSLVERRLVAALNTLIPSYVVRSEDLQFSGG
jgi:hypothetical protein